MDVVEMKFQYLGTAAAEGWPGMFCACDNCRRAITAGGKNIRTRSQAIIDDRLLIDFPPDTYMHVLYNGLDLTKVDHCIITHDHSDHFYPEDFCMRQKTYAHLDDDFCLMIYGTVPAGKGSEKIINLYELDKKNCIKYKYITPFVPFKAGEYTVTALKADHDPLCDPVIYIISDGNKNVLYGNDTGYFPDETWNYLESCKPHLDFVSLDCNCGIENANNRNAHMGFNTDTEVKERLLKISCADKDTVFCLNHFSHNGGAIYDELVPIAQKYGFFVSYDGMTIEI